jgi:hypothetical protein
VYDNGWVVVHRPTVMYDPRLGVSSRNRSQHSRNFSDELDRFTGPDRHQMMGWTQCLSLLVSAMSRFALTPERPHFLEPVWNDL